MTLPGWLAWLLALTLSFPFAGDLEVSTTTTLTPAASAVTVWATRLHAEATRAAGPFSLHLVLDPALWDDGRGTQVIPGLTEAYVRLPAGRLEWSLGVERLPLEVGRLTVPFSLEPVDDLGLRRGRLGLRATFYPDDATRLRLAVLDHDGRLAPILSARRQFGLFELEGHALVLGGRTAVGLGGSGLAGNLVIYGEVWALTAPAEWRYALGLSGSIKSGIWTLEAGYGAPLPGQPPRRQITAQVSRQWGADITWSLSGRVFFDADALRGQAGVEFVRAFPNHELTLTLGGLFGPAPPQAVIRTALRINL